MRLLSLPLPLLVLAAGCRAPVTLPDPDALAWTRVEVPPIAAQSLRGLSVPNERDVWLSGADGLCVRSDDGGRTWRDVSPKSARRDGLDLRSLHAFDAHRACAVSAGPGDASRILLTSDGGSSWRTVLRNEDPEGFFNAVRFWDDERGLALGDMTDGFLTVLRTEDGGASWRRVAATDLPRPARGEVAFAASNRSIAIAPGGRAWIGTGGTEDPGPRVLYTKDFGRTCAAARAPLRAGDPAAGIFAVMVRADGRGVAVGGKYTEPGDARGTAAFTHDGGRTWLAAKAGGYRSAVDAIPGTPAWLAVGISGTDLSLDDGVTWRPIAREGEQERNAVSLTPSGRTAWSVGPAGAVWRMDLTRQSRARQ